MRGWSCWVGEWLGLWMVWLVGYMIVKDAWVVNQDGWVGGLHGL